MQTVSTVRDLRTHLLDWRMSGQTVALVPTMGALHRGHMALVAQARQKAQRVVVSIFVNPLQFGPKEDLTKYPRQLEADQKMLIDNGCDLLFAPTPHDMYAENFTTSIDPGAIALPLEGAFRPTHFAGVATVVAKLLLQAMPDAAFFGEKDYQQLQVIRRIVRDLDIPSHIMGVPIVRDEDGLALSSRNAYLSVDERTRAVALPQALLKAKTYILKGQSVESTLLSCCNDLTAVGFKIDYFELADATTLTAVRDLAGQARLLVAAWIGSTRLIDNIAVNY